LNGGRHLEVLLLLGFLRVKVLGFGFVPRVKLGPIYMPTSLDWNLV